MVTVVAAKKIAPKRLRLWTLRVLRAMSVILILVAVTLWIRSYTNPWRANVNWKGTVTIFSYEGEDESELGWNVISEFGQLDIRPWYSFFEWHIPYWKLALLGASVLLFPLVSLLAARLEHHHAKGCCLNCGYDLRATPEKCPECGADPKTFQPPQKVFTDWCWLVGFPFSLAAAIPWFLVIGSTGDGWFALVPTGVEIFLFLNSLGIARAISRSKRRSRTWWVLAIGGFLYSIAMIALIIWPVNTSMSDEVLLLLNLFIAFGAALVLAILLSARSRDELPNSLPNTKP